MVITLQTVLITAALFIAVFVLGFLLRRYGKPYSGLLLTAHKLISLAVLILFGLTVSRINKTTPLASAALAKPSSPACFLWSRSSPAAWSAPTSRRPLSR